MSLIFNALHPQADTSATASRAKRTVPDGAVRYLHYGLYTLASAVTMTVVYTLLPSASDVSERLATTPVAVPHQPLRHQASAPHIPQVTGASAPVPETAPDVIPDAVQVTTHHLQDTASPIAVTTPARLKPVSEELALVDRKAETASVQQTRRYLAEVQQLVQQLHTAMKQKDADVVNPLLDLLEQRAGHDAAISLKMRAFWLLQQGNNPAAAQLYLRLLTQQPNDQQANLNMALIELRNGERMKAELRVNRLVSLYPNSTQVRRFRQQLEGSRG